MQSYNNIEGNENLSFSRNKINNNIMSVLSTNSGESPPQYNRDDMSIGMQYYDTKKEQLYMLINKGETELGDTWKIINDLKLDAYTSEFSKLADNSLRLMGYEAGIGANKIPILDSNGKLPVSVLENVNANSVQGLIPGTSPNNILKLNDNGFVPQNTLVMADVRSVQNRVPGEKEGNLAIVGKNGVLPMDLQGIKNEVRFIWWTGAKEDLITLIGSTWKIMDGTSGTPNALDRVVSTVNSNTSSSFFGTAWKWIMTLAQMPTHSHTLTASGCHGESGIKGRAEYSSGDVVKTGATAKETSSSGSNSEIHYDFPRMTLYPIIKVV